MNEFGEHSLVKETGGTILELGGLLVLGKTVIDALHILPGTLPMGLLAQGALGFGAMFVGEKLAHS